MSALDSPSKNPTLVVDLFAGPGGLGEGISSVQGKFEIAVSVEADAWAHRTLRFRAFVRQLLDGAFDEKLYRRLIQAVAGNDFSQFSPAIQEAWKLAGLEALNLTIGRDADDRKLRERLDCLSLHNKSWVLVGGPPCQAYSLAGRVRNNGIKGYRPEGDHRHFLYREYLKIIQEYCPAIFVMENVRGILSSSVEGQGIFHRILDDLARPDKALGKAETGVRYDIHTLNAGESGFSDGMEEGDYDPRSFLVYAENHGIPQRRHRVFLVGVRRDLGLKIGNLNVVPDVFVSHALNDLPELRSRLSREADSSSTWKAAVESAGVALAASADAAGLSDLSEALSDAGKQTIRAELGLGSLLSDWNYKADPIESAVVSRYKKWVRNSGLALVLNHESRSHMRSDLGRYLFAAAFARRFSRSPKGAKDFCLEGLRPAHKNWESGKFSDRFRVQLPAAPSTTITSHISKDGHYYIHPDPVQCRSLTVREAARLQTFPDDYFFAGPKTQQYHQVGNAVPPLLASQIAELIRDALGA